MSAHFQISLLSNLDVCHPAGVVTSAFFGPLCSHFFTFVSRFNTKWGPNDSQLFGVYVGIIFLGIYFWSQALVNSRTMWPLRPFPRSSSKLMASTCSNGSWFARKGDMGAHWFRFSLGGEKWWLLKKEPPKQLKILAFEMTRNIQVQFVSQLVCIFVS